MAMQSPSAWDQRQHVRREASLVVSYRAKQPTAIYDITHTRNISRGGMLLTTARAFAPGDLLAIAARLAGNGSPRLVRGTAGAVESKEMVPSLLYEVRDGDSRRVLP